MRKRPRQAISRSNKSGTVRDGNGQSIHITRSSSNGAPDGILGINCGHFASPFFPGLSYKRSRKHRL
ncbi:MAG: phage minor capsid protein [Christensenellaceae bacterium]